VNVVVLDTNPLLRFFLNDIISQADETEKLLIKAKKGQINLLVPQIVIFEMEFALNKYYKFPKSDIVKHLNSVISMDYLNIQNQDLFKQAIEVYEATTLSFPDCFIKSYALKQNAKLFTFDQDLIKL
jgi:predicted nucleic-acid-binding protein